MEPDNNDAERALREVCLGKRIIYFSVVTMAVSAAHCALLYGLIGTCKLNVLTLRLICTIS
ncbi:hypothetical protein [Enterobacter cloacae]|uniref:hypothetical protein n=1 Tax=Enterobacter cloacae TaxID=550 RepID=UPI0034A34B9F